MEISEIRDTDKHYLFNSVMSQVRQIVNKNLGSMKNLDPVKLDKANDQILRPLQPC